MDVMKHLRQVLIECRETKGTYAEVAVEFGTGENVIRKFERGETAPRYSSIDDLVRSYAKVGEVEPGALWDEALRRAHAGPAPTVNGSVGRLDSGSGPGRAAAAARKARETTAGKGSRRGRSKSD
jgi:hypothetical protein